MSRLKDLAFDSPASQDGWEMWKMLIEVSAIKPKSILEIGCDKGGFLYTLTKLFTKANIVGIELEPKDELAGYNIICGNSNDLIIFEKVKSTFPDGIDFVFIDGDHNYAAVKKDFELYSPLVRRGGIIGIHDINSRNIPGVEAGVFFEEVSKNMQSNITGVLKLQRDDTTPGTGLLWL